MFYQNDALSCFYFYGNYAMPAVIFPAVSSTSVDTGYWKQQESYVVRHPMEIAQNIIGNGCFPISNSLPFPVSSGSSNVENMSSEEEASR